MIDPLPEEIWLLPMGVKRPTTAGSIRRITLTRGVIRGELSGGGATWGGVWAKPPGISPKEIRAQAKRKRGRTGTMRILSVTWIPLMELKKLRIRGDFRASSYNPTRGLAIRAGLIDTFRRGNSGRIPTIRLIQKPMKSYANPAIESRKLHSIEECLEENRR
jgi:hypothetical protein